MNHGTFGTLIAATLMMLVTGGTARAADSDTTYDPRGWVLAGGAVFPLYEGAAQYQPFPFVGARIQTGHLYLQWDGLSARINALPWGLVEAGPVLNVTLGRPNDVENDRVDVLESQDPAIEVGGFLGVQLEDVGFENTRLRAAVRVAQDVTDVHGGWQGAATVYVSFAPSDSWNLGAQGELTVASERFNDAYFSIGSNEAELSGLPRFDAEGGLRDLGLILNGSYALSSRWWLTASFGGRRLLGDPEASPLVQLEGSAEQWVGVLGVSYNFF